MDGIEEHPTRLMLRVNDVGVAQVGSAKTDTVNQNQNLPFIKINLILEITYYFLNLLVYQYH